MAALHEPDPEPDIGQWTAAGVLPYTILDGTVLCMLGKEYSLAPSTTPLLVPARPQVSTPGIEPASDSNCVKQPQYRCWWSDFGGGREADDASVAHTAAREWAEETVGVYGDGSSLVSRVENSAKTMLAQLCDSVVQNSSSASLGPTFSVIGNSYTMYLCEVPFVDTLIFQLARDENDAEATVLSCPSAGCADRSSEAVDEEALRKLRRRCGEKRDFAWVSLQSILAAVKRGRTWLRDVEGQMITLLPRLGYTLQTSGPVVLKTISDMLLQSSPRSRIAMPTNTGLNAEFMLPRCTSRKVIVLSLPSRRAGGCSLYLSVRRRRSVVGPVIGNSACSTRTDRVKANNPKTVDEVMAAADLLRQTVKLLPLFGGVRRAVLHCYPAPQSSGVEHGSEFRDPFVLVTFFCPTVASEAREWLNCIAKPRKDPAGAPMSLAKRNPSHPALPEETEIVADFAFFEPKKRRRSSTANSDPGFRAGRASTSKRYADKNARIAGGWGQKSTTVAAHAARGGTGRKTKLGVRASHNAAAAAADRPSELTGAAAMTSTDDTTDGSACS